MAITGNTNIRYSGTDAFDTAESVLDNIVDLAPMQAPMLATMKRGANPMAITREWRLDYSGAWPASMGAVPTRGEGQDADPAATAARPAYFNRTHIIGYDFSVSHTERAVKKFGIEDEYAHQEVKASRKLVRALEHTVMNSTIDVDSLGPNTGAAANKRKMGGLVDLITNPGSYLVSGSTAASADALGHTAAATATMVIGDITGLLNTVWNVGGMPNGYTHGFCNGTAKRVLSALFSPTTASSTVYRREIDGPGKMVDLVVDVVETDFGFLYIHLARSAPSEVLVGVDPEFFELNVLRDFETIDLAKTGPSNHGLVEVEATCSLTGMNTGWKLTAVN
jgi:hypothetical protein